uniref:Capsid polyprotein VP90 n=1 Tax=Reticulitermes speratus dicistrovirus TaxID=3032235 RepID=A0AAT9JPP3_9VIRU
MNLKNENSSVELGDRQLTDEQLQIVHFSSEGVTPSSLAVPDIVDLSTDILEMTTKEDRTHGITDFLSRPVVITSGAWAASQTAGSQLYTANFPESLISNSMYQDKLRGFVGLRATLVVKVQVNSQPFQQGRLMLQYIPYAQYMTNRVSLVNASLTGRSGCPRVDLDLSVGTEIEMRIPYVSPHMYYNMITGQGSFGTIYLVVYSQLRDQITGTGSVEYTVWAHFEDVDVQFPTGANVFTGSAPNENEIGRSKREIGDVDGEPITAQGGGTETEQLKRNNSPSSGLGQISEGLSTLSRLPAIGNVFAKASWVAGNASNILKILGWSKPTSQGDVCESKLRTAMRMANYDGVDSSHKMALSSENQLETKSGLAGTSADEMELSHVLSVPNYWHRFTWATTDATGKELFTDYVTPMKIKPWSSTITDRFLATHLGFVSNTFGFWRGSLIYTFKFVKTQFHSGRLAISFIPYYYNSTISTGTPDLSRSQRVIVDLRTSTEVSFTVPYVSSRMWMYCIKPDASWLSTNSSLMYNCATGIVKVDVLNNLVAANNVYQSIDCIVEVAGGPDLEFAAPSSPSYIPYGGTFTSSRGERSVGKKKKKKETTDEDETVEPIDVSGSPALEELVKFDSTVLDAEAQVLGTDEAIARNDAQHGEHPQSINLERVKANWSPVAMCMGEKIMSIRQLIKRFGSWRTLDIKPTVAANGQTMVILPFTVNAPPTTVPGTASIISMLDYYYYIYAFWRGSVRIKMNIQSYSGTAPNLTYQTERSGVDWKMYCAAQDTLNAIVTSLNADGTPIQIVTLANARKVGGCSQLYIDSHIEGLQEIEIPYYNVSHISPAYLVGATESPLSLANAYKGHVPPVAVLCEPLNTTADVTGTSMRTYRFMRAAGDDYSLMYLLGCPPLVNVSS